MDGRVRAIVDRKEAIQFAIRNAEPGDLVLLVGKGHEKTQMIGGTGAAVRRSGDRARRRWSGDADARQRSLPRIRGARVSGSGRRSRDRRVFDRHPDDRAGDLFIAIRGERFDGNAYVVEAVRERGRLARSSAIAALSSVPELAIDAADRRARHDCGAAAARQPGAARFGRGGRRRDRQRRQVDDEGDYG